jgi:hypothetical protein
MAIAAKNLTIGYRIRAAGCDMMRFPTATLSGFPTVFPYQLFVTPHIGVVMSGSPALAVAAGSSPGILNYR